MVDSAAKQGQAVSTTKFGPSATSHPNIIWKSDPTLHEASWSNVIVFFLWQNIWAVIAFEATPKTWSSTSSYFFQPWRFNLSFGVSSLLPWRCRCHRCHRFAQRRRPAQTGAPPLGGLCQQVEPQRRQGSGNHNAGCQLQLVTKKGGAQRSLGQVPVLEQEI